MCIFIFYMAFSVYICPESLFCPIKQIANSENEFHEDRSKQNHRII